MAQKVEYLPTKPKETDPKINSWKKPRVHIIGIDNDVRDLFTRYGYITRSGHFTEVQDDVDLVCFTGGADLNPRLYGQTMNPETFPDSQRDMEEVEAFHRYRDVPRIGICRGLQLLNVLHGGTLIQHVHNHNGVGNHEIVDVWGKKLQTSSVHHQMCVPPTEDAQVLAWAENRAFKNSNDPEMIWYPKTNCFGVQGHPEWGPDEFSDYFMIMLKELVLPYTRYKTRNEPSQPTVH